MKRNISLLEFNIDSRLNNKKYFERKFLLFENRGEIRFLIHVPAGGRRSQTGEFSSHWSSAARLHYTEPNIQQARIKWTSNFRTKGKKRSARVGVSVSQAFMSLFYDFCFTFLSTTQLLTGLRELWRITDANWQTMKLLLNDIDVMWKAIRRHSNT